ncbi:hypothetical protein CYMTET_42322 [Cymbomonas tetramitiformis]|uniref:Uncharacterized protein n=1 Tax=Cymbomonas tetramitiformis TaxID=36881 RepID=A0AAE0C4D7_9CHLO|nr:hypothetical protein CYMTET_42322 [Cymbomonas tetramitiformis]
MQPKVPNMSTAGSHPNYLNDLKENIQSRVRSGSLLSLRRCQKLTERVIDVITRQGEEDFRLLATLQQQIISLGLEEPVLATVGADDTAERISALLQESQLECELEEYSDCTKEKMDLLKKRLNRRLIDLVDIANLCRAERIRMLSGMLGTVASSGRAARTPHQHYSSSPSASPNSVPSPHRPSPSRGSQQNR